MGVTSWGYGENAPQKQMGASPFTSDNIQVLLYGTGDVSGACNLTPAAC